MGLDEAQIVTSISSANIACGGHAGDKASMATTVANAVASGVAIGAHPAYPDRDNFGRKSLLLGYDIEPEALTETLTQQINTLIEIAAEKGGRVRYVKPHGALYNDAVQDREKADLIAAVVSAIDPSLVFLGGPNSEMGKAAEAAGLTFVAEGFIDRRYTDGGHLVSRALPRAVIEDQEDRLAQAKALATTGEVQTDTGRTLRINARSLCVHGDSAGAVKTAQAARAAIESMGVQIKAFAP
ncbi:5-oxoprolinase subunit PxpA [Litorimonas sp. RW-G-Af-16]|uniref:5-oxoprolinase subunit PxpA n=1 Tax=Litorimonas sp. RW-G-Af-16 TaxID=3241168 RepID=UPI003AADC33F